jgi:putative transposase
LLPNHFHLLIRVKEEATLFKKASLLAEKATLLQEASLLDANKQFHKFFTCYAKAVNKQQNRTGSLFQKPYKRIEITNSRYLTNLVFYIHANPQLHDIVGDFRMYPWSSYKGILINNPSKLENAQVIEWFDDKRNFMAFHAQKIEYAILKDLMIE